jgi:ABC-type branched-subunit amino acid transport system ATPase component
VLDAADITVRFGALVAVDRLSLTIGDGEVVGLVGPNGSGKSTFINAVTGLVPAAGTVRVNDKQVKLGTPGVVSRQGVLRTFQTPQVHDGLICLENVLVGLPERSLRSLPAAWFRRFAMMKAERARWEVAAAALEYVGLGKKIHESGGSLSYGERRRLELARVYAGKPSVLLLDEPAAGLNHRETVELVDLLLRWRSQGGPAMMIVEHKIDFLERICDRVVVMELGHKIAEGTAAQVWADPKVQDAYLGRLAESA